jgi:hypothetical protein
MNSTEPAAEKIVSAQFAALVRRLSDGVPLTGAQLEFVKDHMAARAASRIPPEAAGADVIATNASELASILGITRQLISYHRGRAGSPETLSVQAWRRYLAIHAKGDVAARMADAGKPTGHGEPMLNFGDGVGAMLACTGRNLHGIVAAVFKAAGVRVTPAKLDTITFSIFMRLAGIADDSLVNFGFESVFVAPDPEPGEEPGHWEAAAITAIAKRITARGKKSGKLATDDEAESPENIAGDGRSSAASPDAA